LKKQCEELKLKTEKDVEKLLADAHFPKYSNSETNIRKQTTLENPVEIVDISYLPASVHELYTTKASLRRSQSLTFSFLQKDSQIVDQRARSQSLSTDPKQEKDQFQPLTSSPKINSSSTEKMYQTLEIPTQAAKKPKNYVKV
jgi:hypothetical protein